MRDTLLSTNLLILFDEEIPKIEVNIGLFEKLPLRSWRQWGSLCAEFAVVSLIGWFGWPVSASVCCNSCLSALGLGVRIALCWVFKLPVKDPRVGLLDDCVEFTYKKSFNFFVYNDFNQHAKHIYIYIYI